MAAIVTGAVAMGLHDASGTAVARPAALAPLFLVMKHAGFSLSL